MTLLRTILFCLLCAPAWGQQVELSWPTNYGQVTVESSTNGGYNWTAIAMGEFTNIIISATNQQNASTLQFLSDGSPYWLADCAVHYQFRVWWDYTQQEVWVPEQSWPNNTGGSYQPAIPAHWVWDNITSTIIITRLP